MASSSLYIYCFIKEQEDMILGRSMIDGSISPVFTVPYQGIAAVVSASKVMEFEPTRKNILAHHRVINEITKKYSIIPVAFGMVAASRKEVEKMIKLNLDQFFNLSDFFKDKMELGLRVTWDNEFFNEDIQNEEINRLKEKVAGKSEEEVMMEKIELGRLVESQITFKKEQYVKEIFEPLSKLAVESKLKEGIPIKTVFNGCFLIEESKSDDFDKQVDNLAKPFENKLKFSYTGPWPPYNFIDATKFDINITEHE